MRNDKDQSLTIDQLAVGQSYSRTVTVTAEMIDHFGQATGDTNPIHHDDAYAAKTRFGRRIAQGMLTVGAVGGIFGTAFPGLGTVYISQEVKFLSPVFVDDQVTLTVTITEILPERNRVRFLTEAVNQRGQKVLTGKAEVMPPEKGAQEDQS